MRSKITKSIVTNTQDLKFGYWDEMNEEFIPVDLKDVKRIAKILKSSPKLLEAIISTFNYFSDSINADLIDIWNRLDKLERKIEENKNAKNT